MCGSQLLAPLSVPIFRMGEHLCSRQARGRGKGASHSLGKGRVLLLHSGSLRALVLLCQGQARGWGPEQAETGPLFPLAALGQGWGSPRVPGWGLGPRQAGRVPGSTSVPSTGWGVGQHCLPSQLLEWRTRGLDLPCNLRPDGLADPPCPHLRKFTPQHHAWLWFPSASLMGTEDQVMAGWPGLWSSLCAFGLGHAHSGWLSLPRLPGPHLMVHSELLLFYPVSAVLFPHGPWLSQAIFG